jgi:DNA polymerase III subunit epsilon
VRIITGLDLESTGLDVEKDRIVEIALLGYDFDTREKKFQFVKRIQPQKAIAAAAQAVHGISLADLAGCPVFSDVSELVEKIIKSSRGLVAHNGIDFDVPMLAHELLRAGRQVPTHMEIVDTKYARWACPDGKSPRLGELAFALEVPYDESKAHGAHYDVDVMMQCFFKGMDKGFFEKPKGFN